MMNEIIEIYLPEGLPSENLIKEMKDQKEIDELFQKQSEIISQFRKFAVSELTALDFEIKRTKILIHQIKDKENEEKVQTDTNKIKNVSEIQRNDEIISQSTPQRVQKSVRINETPQKSSRKTPRRNVTPKKILRDNKKCLDKIDAILKDLDTLIK